MHRFVRGVTSALTLGVALLSASSVLAAGATVAEDHFRRDMNGGWGQASPGGSYTLTGRAADFWTSTQTYQRGLGYMRVPSPGVTRSALLVSARATDVEIHLTATITATGPDGPFYVYAVVRQSSAGELRARLTYNRDCTVTTSGSIVESGRERPLGSPVTLPNIRWCGPNASARTFNLHAQAVGSAPATVRINVWPANGSTEPTGWMWKATPPVAPSGGAVGLRAYVSSGSMSGTDFVFYNWSARQL